VPPIGIDGVIGFLGGTGGRNDSYDEDSRLTLLLRRYKMMAKAVKAANRRAPTAAPTAIPITACLLTVSVDEDDESLI